MEWVKLATRLPRDPRIRAAQARCPHARDLFILGLCYVGEQETDGFVPAFEPESWQIPRPRAAVAALVAEGLWLEAVDGWQVTRWLDHQQSKAQVEANRRAAAHRQSRLRQRRSDGVTDPVSHGVTDGVSHTTREEKRRTTPLPPQAGGSFRSACERHRARPKAGCADCARPAPTKPHETPVKDLCPHGRHEPSCPFCLKLLEVSA